MGNEAFCQCTPGGQSRSKRTESDSLIQLIKFYKGIQLQVIQGDPIEQRLHTLINCSFEPAESLIVKHDRHIKKVQREQLRSMKVEEVLLIPIKKINVIHCKLPMFQEVKDLRKVYQSYLNCLNLAEINKLDTLVFTEQNTSNFAIPKQYNSETLIRAILNHINSTITTSNIKNVSFISNDYVTLNMVKYELEKQLDEMRIPELAEKNNKTYFQFINNELIEEKQYYFSTGITTSFDQGSQSKEQLNLDQ